MSTALSPMETKVLSFESSFNAVNAYKLNFKKEANFALQLLKSNNFLRETAQKNPDALEAALTNIAAIGISLNPASKEAYLVPRGGKVCLDISYIGLIKLATDSGSVEWVQAEVVKKNDTFKFNGVGKSPTHEMNPFSDRGEVLGVYCVAKLSSGEYLSTIMSAQECNDVRDKSSQASKTGPWKDFYEEMIKKTVIKRASKLWPKSARLDEAIQVLNEHEGLETAKTPHVDLSAFDGEIPTEEALTELRELLVSKGRTEEQLLAYLSMQFNHELTTLEQLGPQHLNYAKRILAGKPKETV